MKIYIQGLRMGANAGTHAPGRAEQHFDFFDSISDRDYKSLRRNT